MFIQSIINAAASARAAAAPPARVSDAQSPLPSPVRDARGESAVREAMEAANEALRSVSSALQFRIDQDSGKAIVLVVNTETREVIRQIPSEDIIAIGREIDRLQGVLMRSKA